MQEQVKKYLDRTARSLSNASPEYVASVLREEGLMTKEYAEFPQPGPSVSYPFYDEEKSMYYREEPLQVTHEEWEAIREAYERKKSSKNQFFSTENKIAFLLTLAGLAVYALALILGFTAGQKISELINDLGRYSGGYIDMQDNSFMVTLVIWVIGFAKGTSLLGISELIKASKKKS